MGRTMYIVCWFLQCMFGYMYTVYAIKSVQTYHPCIILLLDIQDRSDDVSQNSLSGHSSSSELDEDFDEVPID